jgi:Zn-finger nucleic acid-binding protein
MPGIDFPIRKNYNVLMPREKMTRFLKILLRRDTEAPVADRLLCSACQAPLSSVEGERHILARCAECRGTWISHSQLHEVLGQISSTAGEIDSDGYADIAHTFAPSRANRPCPECRKCMENFKFEATGVWVDSCPDGHGLWLDNGELRLLAERRRKGTVSGGDEPDSVFDAVSDLIIGSL